MHPRNIYKVPPDFSKLAIKYPEFLKISCIDLNGTVRIDFTEPNTLRVLTKCLLHSDFGLDVDIPVDRLVPTVPLRLNYLLWLEDVLSEVDRKSDIIGIDIGTGACAVYPLLAATKFKWKMFATEIDENSVNMALKNIKQNKLDNEITVKKVEPDKEILLSCFDISGGPLKEVDFCMCNPPFFSCVEDMDQARSPLRAPPRNARTGSLKEMITAGGEISFVKKLINESKILKDKVRIYTTMLGHKTSLKPLLKFLHDSEITQIAHTTFCQGRTTRWGLAWSFVESCKLCTKPPDKSKKFNKCMSFVVPPIEGIEYNVKAVTRKLLEIFIVLELKFQLLQQKDVITTMEIKASKNTWSNQRKLRRQVKGNNNSPSAANDSLETIEMADETQNTNQELCNNTNDSLKRKGDDCLDCSIVAKKSKFDNGESPMYEPESEIKSTNGSTKDSSSVKNTNKNFLSTNSTITASSTNSVLTEDFLTAAVCIRKQDKCVVLEIGYVKGIAGKDGVHQIVQYVKNNWR